MRLEPDEGGSRFVDALRWSGAGLLVATAHIGAGWWIIAHPITQATPPDTVQGIPIDLEPIAVPQNAPAPNTTTSSGDTAPPQAAAGPELVAQNNPASATPEPAVTSPPEPPPPEPPPPEPVRPEPQPMPPPAVEPPPEPPPPVEEPQPPPAPPPVTLPEKDTKSDAVLAPPPKPRLAPPKPDPRALARAAARKKAMAERREQQRTARAEAGARAQAEQTRRSGGQGPQDNAPSSASSGASISSWRGEVLAHLNSFKPAAPNNAVGTARVSFSVDRSGRVLSASLAGSSGDPTLDAMAVTMVRRASPIPAPPPELGGRVTATVPVYFH